MCATAAPRCASRSIRCGRIAAIDAVGIDFYPPLSDWRDGADHADLAEARSPYDLDYLRARVAGGEAFDWYYAERGRPARADAHADHRRRLRQALGVPRQGPRRAGGRTRMSSASAGSRRPRPPGRRARSRSGSPRSAFRRSTRGRTRRTSFPIRSRRNRRSRRSRAAAATTSSRRAPSKRSCPASIPRSPGHPAGANPVSPVYGGPMVDPGARVRLGLGRAAFPGLSGFRSRLGGCGELADRPLDHRPARGHAPRPAHRRRARRFRPRRRRRWPSTASSTAM